jgi:fused signal recognition particle receptor
MLFNKKKREAKKLQKEREQQAAEKAKEIAEQITAAEREMKERPVGLTKDIVVPVDPQVRGEGFFQRVKKGLSKTRALLIGSLNEMSADEPIDDDYIEDLEERLLAADLGYRTTEKIIDILKQQLADRRISRQTEAVDLVKRVISGILDRGEAVLPKATLGPTVVLFVGVNGVGKTTSIGKMAHQLRQSGKKVLVAAGDTFRAAAIEQLEEWCRRAGVDIVAKEINSDPAAVMYEAASRAVEEAYDVLLCDTSGRLHTKKNLMDELAKMHKVLQKIIPEAPHASLLVLDANTGQNAIVQTREFAALIGLSGLVITKLDGTAKGGVIIGIVNEFEIPVYYVGIGEGLDDLQPFSARVFADSLFA